MRRFLFGITVVALLSACESSTDVDPNEAGALTWITANATPLASLDPVDASYDLAPFITMAADARIIGLGEGTHGSHEFFTLKDRLFRHLVEDDGVTGFAIEASMPDAFGIDTYVRTGAGDPAVLLSHLYFWTWNTQEVADLIAWLRQWNQDHPAKQVGFYGFDLQYPGAAIDSVINFLGRADPSIVASVDSEYDCLDGYRNDSHGQFAKSYSVNRSVWSDCRLNIAAAQNQLKQNHGALAAATSERDYAFALQMSQIVVQWELLMERLTADVRDAEMADNVAWLLDREGPGGKLVLWAHNYHVSRFPPSMGYKLAGRFGADYLPVGFAFGSGEFNAEEALGNGQAGPVRVNEAPEPVPDSYEALLSRAPSPNYYFDMRQADGDAAAWFSGSRRFRSIGLIYYDRAPESHYTSLVLSYIYDVVFFTKDITASTLLPFQY
jgi:erythromycin esterase